MSAPWGVRNCRCAKTPIMPYFPRALRRGPVTPGRSLGVFGDYSCKTDQIPPSPRRHAPRPDPPVLQG
jgi:hypothetical protein